MNKYIYFACSGFILNPFTFGQVEDTNVLDIGKWSEADDAYLHSNVVGFPFPRYAIIEVEKDPDVSVVAIANSGWILFNDGTRWKWGFEEHLQIPDENYFLVSGMNNRGDVIGSGENLNNEYTALVWAANSSNGSLLVNAGDSTYAHDVDDLGNFYGSYSVTNEINPPLTYSCYGEDCLYWKSFYTETTYYISNIDDNFYEQLAVSNHSTGVHFPATLVFVDRGGEDVVFRDTYYDDEAERLDYIRTKSENTMEIASEFITISNFAPQALDMISDTIGKDQIVVGHTKDNQQYCVWRDGVVTLLGEYAEAGQSEKIWIATLPNQERLIAAGKEIWLNIKNSVGALTGNYLRSSLDELLPRNSGWNDLQARAVSDNGLIAGVGKLNGQLSTFLLLKVDVVPDYDRDGVIRDQPWTDSNGKLHPSDYNKAAGNDPFYFWVNEDRDSFASLDVSFDLDAPSGSVPSMDAADTEVGGIRDLEDFFPVFIDLNGLLDNMNVTKVQIELLGAKVNWLNFPEDYIGLTENSAKFYLENVVKAEEWGSATTTHAGEGVYFTQKMVERIRDGRGIILLEGREAGDEALQLRFSYDGTELFTYDMELKLSSVENMYRHLNLMGNIGQSGGVATNTSVPSGFPDSESNGKHFVFVHGYNVNTEQARGWNAETFKRLYWSGSRAKFTGATWWGFRSQVYAINAYKTPNYYENIINAHRTGSYLSSALSGYSGDLTIAAHSMGSVVISSAIVDHDLSYNRFFLINAAVATEAYDSGTITPGIAANMTNVHYQDYEGRLYASNWHNLFTDNRSSLTWKDRFGPINNAYNFYSSGEEVLANGDGTEPSAWQGFFQGYRAWNTQELKKGDYIMESLPDTDNRSAGWGFNYNPPDNTNGSPASGYYEPIGFGIPGYRKYTPTEAAALTDDELRNNPFFYPFQSTDSDYGSYNGDNLYGLDGDPTASNQAGLYLTRAKLLAEAIPALSYATGRNSVGAFDQPGGSRNIDINAVGLRNGWPSSRSDSDWKHSDIKNIPYTYVYPFYEELVEIGGLDAE